jgi:hypothetical protein
MQAMAGVRGEVAMLSNWEEMKLKYSLEYPSNSLNNIKFKALPFSGLNL